MKSLALVLNVESLCFWNSIWKILWHGTTFDRVAFRVKVDRGHSSFQMMKSILRLEVALSTILVTGAHRGFGLVFAMQYSVRDDDVIGACRELSDAPTATGERVDAGVDVTDGVALLVSAIPGAMNCPGCVHQWAGTTVSTPRFPHRSACKAGKGHVLNPESLESVNLRINNFAHSS